MTFLSKRFTYFVILPIIIFTIFIIGMHNAHALEKEQDTDINHQEYASFVNSTIDETFITEKEKRKTWHITASIRNNGENNLLISQILTGCECTKATFKHPLVKSGACVPIDIEYNSRNKESHFQKDVMILFNGGKYFYIIKIHD